MARKVRHAFMSMANMVQTGFIYAALAVGIGPESGSGLLLESPADSFLLLENDDFILLE